MKRNKSSLAALLAALSFFTASSAIAIPQSQITAIKKAVADVPVAEVAAKAAEIVTQASKADQQEVAITTVRAIVSRRPSTAPAVVGAISKAAPETSAAVAAEAAKLSNDQAGEIAKAAAAAAPAQADKIAAAVAKAVPQSATKIARVVVSTVPTEATRITESVIAAVPTAQTQIANDTTITRISQNSAHGTTPVGIITSRPGNIRGTPSPNIPPIAVTNPTLGEDSARRYGRP